MNKALDTNNIETNWVYDCPKCGKHRLFRPPNHKVIDTEVERQLPDGEKIKVGVDWCSVCIGKLAKKVQGRRKLDATKIAQAMTEMKQLPEGQSLEDLL